PRLTYHAKVDHIGGGVLLNSEQPRTAVRHGSLAGIARHQTATRRVRQGSLLPRPRPTRPAQGCVAIGSGWRPQWPSCQQDVVLDDRDPETKNPASCRRESEARSLTSDFPGARYFADELN